MDDDARRRYLRRRWEETNNISDSELIQRIIEEEEDVKRRGWSVLGFHFEAISTILTAWSVLVLMERRSLNRRLRRLRHTPQHLTLCVLTDRAALLIDDHVIDSSARTPWREYLKVHDKCFLAPDGRLLTGETICLLKLCIECIRGLLRLPSFVNYELSPQLREFAASRIPRIDTTQPHKMSRDVVANLRRISV